MQAGFFYIIFNPAAGSGTAVEVFKKIKQVLDDRKIQYEIKVSRYSGHAIQLAKQIGSFNQQAGAVMLVIGGDGTLNQAITGLRQTRNPQMPVGYIPAGSGNDFARGIGMSQDPMVALEQVLQASQPIVRDIGHYTEKTRGDTGYFVNNVGVGFDAAAVAATNRSRFKKVLNRLHLGSLAYMVGVLTVFFSRKPFPVAVYVNGKRTYIPQAFLVTTTNHPYFGGGVRILPSAKPTDGKLDLIVVEHLNTPYFLFLCLQLLLGRHTHYRRVHVFEAARIELETSSLEFGQMDGEEMGSRPYELAFRVEQQKFWVDLT
ncbi:diacylglycerol/lipid kinase family protein [Lacticaseibacillus baoqingensis]|uniref:Diacylglycerol/lipid kinase family protein n=1 Tax=Lacticaseibacillus baoqingensis TaxID=2486013 RepID=A0ABW4E4E5_9LACO|nr:diacylglycerol kinase family protein [Lacticaseibacillus baoqingensis]